METQLQLIQMVQTHKPDMLFLDEHMVAYNSIPSWFWHRIRLNNYVVKDRNSLLPNIWCLGNLLTIYCITQSQSMHCFFLCC